MNNTRKQNGSAAQSVFGQSVLIKHYISGGMLASVLYAGAIQAAGEVSQVQTIEQPGTPTTYEIDGRTFYWGMGSNQIMEGFSVAGQSFQFAGTADRVELIRNDVNGVSTGNPCGVFVEKLGASSDVLKANYPSDGSDTGNCDMAAMLASRVVNRGALDLFSNTGDYPKNVERVDYLYDSGVLAPLTSSALSQSGHVVAEKSGNNPLQVAAVTDLDMFGQPSAFGPLVYVDRNSCSGDTICYGITNLRHNYAFFQNNSFSPQGYPSHLRDSTEPVGMAFVSLQDLGLEAGQVYYGFSYFADDVDSSIHTLTDVTTFPNDTNDEEIVFGDGPDIYGGVAGYYLGTGLSIAMGSVFKDENGDDQLGENEAGISDLGLTLFEDTNGNGVFDPDEDAQLGPMFNTDASGSFNIPGLEDGVFFLLIDETDADLPPALDVVPGSNPAMIVIQGNDANDVNFGLISETGPTEGADAGASDVDAGATDASTGDADSGVTDGAVDAEGTTDAGTDDGVTDGVDAGGTTDTGTDDGITDGAGGTTDTGTDDGVTDGAVDAGGTTDAGTDVDQQNDDAAVTAAIPDSASVNQGSSVIIPVLANDTDAAGGGLTIISALESMNNATIEVDEDNGTIEYTPPFGFIGMDSFMYVIEDDAGTQATGTVAVDVVRFADLNDNGLNDFDECNCENLTIEVGLEGSALGGSSLFSFLILTFMVGARSVFQSRRAKAFGVMK